jgi:hypothetical protein
MTLEIAIALALWLVVLVALGVLFARTARRMTRLAARTRELGAYQTALAELSARTAVAVDPVIAHLDEVRRRSGDPVRVAASVARAAEEIAAACEDAGALRSPLGLEESGAHVVFELERIGRALDLIDHGLTGLVGVRGPRELEIQTTLKRGALNLRHARDAIAAVASDIASARPSDMGEGAARRPFAARSTPSPGGPQAASAVARDADSDPSM